MDYYAYYYDWWESSGWANVDGQTVKDYPELGRYNCSQDVEVIRQHIRWAKEAGLKGFITTYWEGILSAVDVLVQVAEEENFKLGIITEFLGKTLAEKDRQLTLFFNRYGNRAPFKTWNNKTLVVNWASWEQTAAEWAPIVSKYTDKAVMLCCENSWDVGTGYIAKMAYFDGNAPYSPTMVPRYPERFRLMAENCRNMGKIFLCPIGPGMETETVNIPRENGDFYKRSNATARSFNPSAIGIISWNEFYENTHIEPSEKYGDFYLRLTKSFTQRANLGALALLLLGFLLIASRKS